MPRGDGCWRRAVGEPPEPAHLPWLHRRAISRFRSDGKCAARLEEPVSALFKGSCVLGSLPSWKSQHRREAHCEEVGLSLSSAARAARSGNAPRGKIFRPDHDPRYRPRTLPTKLHGVRACAAVSKWLAIQTPCQIPRRFHIPLRETDLVGGAFRYLTRLLSGCDLDSSVSAGYGAKRIQDPHEG